MTRFADPDVYSCPACAAYFIRSRFKSLSYGGARYWSDGAPTDWWATDLQPLVRCKACAAIFWIDDLQPLGIVPRRPRPIGRLERLWTTWRGDPDGRIREEQEWLNMPVGWEAAERVDTASFEDVVHVLSNSGVLRSERLLWLRSCIWWTLNDRHRFRSDGTPVPNVPRYPEAEERSNMVALIDLLNERLPSPASQVQKGELLRLLGRFDEAIEVLRLVPVDRKDRLYKNRALDIEGLARRGDLKVRLLGEVPFEVDS